MARGHYDRTRIPRRGRPGFLREILGDLDRDWMSRALCRLIPLSEVDETFFPIYGRSHEARRAYAQRVSRAKAVCNQCPVKRDCEQYRASMQDDNGVWGGRDEIDRDPNRSGQPPGRPRLRSSQEGSTHMTTQDQDIARRALDDFLAKAPKGPSEVQVGNGIWLDGCTPELPRGADRPRIRLWDRDFHNLYDSATATATLEEALQFFNHPAIVTCDRAGERTAYLVSPIVPPRLSDIIDPRTGKPIADA